MDFGMFFERLAFALLLTSEMALGYSIWEPFCNEEKIYTPYVRVFKKGRNGAMLRDRGPGFIDLSGQKDIYVCTNGLVMMYYAKTSAMGDVYEAGELHWTPHHCELYNPSSNNGQRPDFPKKSLLSILLIGHPHDFRLPAMQMFVAPMYDQKHGGYINATSIIMIGTDGECIVEKGSERARLRIRLDSKKVIEQTFQDNVEAAMENKPFTTYPPMFCQLDVQHKLGQNAKGLINLKIPNDTFIPYRHGNTPVFYGTKYMDKSAINHHDKYKEMGSFFEPRFRASETPRWKDLEEKEKKVALLADQVYTALLADRKMHFVGCLRYPDFNEDQMRIIREKKAEYVPLKESMAMVLKNYTVAKEDGNNFWAEVIQKLPWAKGRSNETQDKTRFEVYFDGAEMFSSVSSLKTFNATELDMEQSKARLLTAKLAAKLAANGSSPHEIYTSEQEYTKSICSSMLWPFAGAYAELYQYVTEVGEKLAEHWGNLESAILGEEVGGAAPDSHKARKHGKKKAQDVPQSDQGDSQSDQGDSQSGQGQSESDGSTNSTSPADVTRLPLHKLTEMRFAVMQTLSQTKYDRRFEPYNPNLVREHDKLLADYAKLSTLLKLKTQMISPWISNVETLTTRFKVYKSLLMRAHDELVAAVKHQEHAGCVSGLAPPAGDPFDRTLADTMIEIADASKDEKGTPFEPSDPEYSQAKACNMLPTVNETCKSIKPHTTRAEQLLMNVKGKGKDWLEDDQWRGQVLDILEGIFTKSCPYISAEFAVMINRIIKGYLIGFPAGTGLSSPVNGSRLASMDTNYQGKVYNDTYLNMAPSNWSVPPSTKFSPVAKLNPKVSFWDQIIEALERCDSEVNAMQFYHNEEDDQPEFITLRKHHESNNTEEYLKVNDLVMEEKAEQEFAFNWAIEMNWRIFGTVLGICMPKYEYKIPLITARFYALYSQDFLHPLRQIWMSHRDNPILRQILGNYYGTCKGDKWAKICMESSYVESGDRSFRPPRYLYVNAFTEMNYFTSGPMAGSSGMLGMVGNGQD